MACACCCLVSKSSEQADGHFRQPQNCGC
uniref:Uncharacterized protein n=1 Tax=Arundo donax TaxID=35708 RepID=A0A0A9GIE8_ARUDO